MLKSCHARLLAVLVVVVATGSCAAGPSKPIDSRLLRPGSATTAGAVGPVAPGDGVSKASGPDLLTPAVVQPTPPSGAMTPPVETTPVAAGPGTAMPVAPAENTVPPGITATFAAAVATASAMRPLGAGQPQGTMLPPGVPSPTPSVPVIAFTAPSRARADDPLSASPRVTSPFSTCVTVSGIVLEPAGRARPGHGHVLILADPKPADVQSITQSGRKPIPADARTRHLDDGGTCIQLDLPPGPHMLLAALADGLDLPLKPAVVNVLQVEVIGQP